MNRKKKPSILLWDIETSLSIVSTFSLYPDSISPSNIIQEPYIMCASWKWLGQDKVHSIKLSSRCCLECDDRKVVNKLHELVEEADIIIGHNGDKFDLKWLKGRCLKHRLKPLAFVTTIDTLKVCRKHFKLMSNRLDYIGQYLRVGRKIRASMDLWMDILKGKTDAMNKMVIYNKQDVLLLEEVYLKVRPWIDNHPNIANILNGTQEQCKACGSDNIIKYGHRYTAVNVYQKFLCKAEGCGHVFTNGKSIKRG